MTTKRTRPKGLSGATRSAVIEGAAMVEAGNPEAAKAKVLSCGDGWKSDPDAVLLLFMACVSSEEESSWAESMEYARMWLRMSFSPPLAVSSRTLQSNPPDGDFAISLSEHVLRFGREAEDRALAKAALSNDKVIKENPTALLHLGSLAFESGDFSEAAVAAARFVETMLAPENEHQEENGEGVKCPCSPTELKRGAYILAMSLFAIGEHAEAMKTLNHMVIPLGVGTYSDPPPSEEYEEEIELHVAESGGMNETGILGKDSQTFNGFPNLAGENPKRREKGFPKVFPSVFELPDGSFIKAF